MTTDGMEEIGLQLLRAPLFSDIYVNMFPPPPCLLFRFVSFDSLYLLWTFSLFPQDSPPMFCNFSFSHSFCWHLCM